MSNRNSLSVLILFSLKILSLVYTVPWYPLRLQISSNLIPERSLDFEYKNMCFYNCDPVVKPLSLDWLDSFYRFSEGSTFHSSVHAFYLRFV